MRRLDFLQLTLLAPLAALYGPLAEWLVERLYRRAWGDPEDARLEKIMQTTWSHPGTTVTFTPPPGEPLVATHAFLYDASADEDDPDALIAWVEL